MGERRTAWHYYLGRLLDTKAPRGFEVRAEEPLTRALQHMDWLVLRRRTRTVDPQDRGETLVELWPRLPQVSVAEFKSASKGYRPRDLHRLIGYGHQYFSANPDEAGTEADLGLVLLVGERNRTLDDDVTSLGLREEPQERGYSLLRGGAFATVVVDFGALVERLPEEYVGLFAGRASAAVPAGSAAAQWWYDHFGPLKENAMDPRNLEDYEAVARRFATMLTPEQRLAMLTPEQRLAGLAPEQRLAGLAPEQRLAGLAPEQRLAGLSEAEQVLALPASLLRALSSEYVATLPPDVQLKVRARRGE